MHLPKNIFKQKLSERRVQLGIFIGLAEGYSAEIAALAGFDWLLIDGEHSPNDLKSFLTQLQAIAPYESQAIIRPPIGDPVIIKQLLDIGVQTLLIPMVETAEQAALMVQSMHYHPEGIRGVGSALARAARWNMVDDYLNCAATELCLLIQIETLKGIKNLEAILAVPGIDGVFIGPSDLSASMGYRNNLTHPEVQATIKQALTTIDASGIASGILYADPDYAKEAIALGCSFVAVGVDTILLINAYKNVLGHYQYATKKPR